MRTIVLLWSLCAVVVLSGCLSARQQTLVVAYGTATASAGEAATRVYADSQAAIARVNKQWKALGGAYTHELIDDLGTEDVRVGDIEFQVPSTTTDAHGKVVTTTATYCLIKAIDETNLELPATSVQLRLEVMKALHEYGELLMVLANGDHTAIDGHLRNIGDALATAAKIDEETIAGAVSLSSSLASALTGKRRLEGIRAAVQTARPHVNALCDLLVADIGPNGAMLLFYGLAIERLKSMNVELNTRLVVGRPFYITDAQHEPYLVTENATEEFIAGVRAQLVSCVVPEEERYLQTMAAAESLRELLAGIQSSQADLEIALYNETAALESVRWFIAKVKEIVPAVEAVTGEKIDFSNELNDINAALDILDDMQAVKTK